MTSKTRRFLGTIGLATGLLLPFANANAQLSNLRELTAQWWQWALSIPTAVNPMLVGGKGATSEDCVVGQRGSVWFLAGTFSGGTVVRNCPVPEGTTLFFPVANSVNFNTPNVCGQGPADLTVSSMRALSASFVNGLVNLEVAVDDRPAAIIRVQSEVFAVALPVDNVFNAPCVAANLGTVPAGIYSPGVDDGYYVLLNPLRPGSHTLHFHAENPSQGFTLDVTYNLTVVPVSSR
jgi:hypothetical protein